MDNYIKYFLFSLILTTISYSQQPDTTFSVSGLITNVEKGKAVFIALFSNQKDFKKHIAYKKQGFKRVDVSGNPIHYVFDNVESGEYIIVAFQDINGDKKINIGIFGPKEPCEIFKPKKSLFRPKFEKCKFCINTNIGNANIVLK